MFILVSDSVLTAVTSTSQMNRVAKIAPFAVFTTMSKMILSPVLPSKIIQPALHQEPSHRAHVKIAARCIIHYSHCRFNALFAVLFDKLSRNINGLFNLNGSSMDTKVGGSTCLYILSSQVPVRAMV